MEEPYRGGSLLVRRRQAGATVGSRGGRSQWFRAEGGLRRARFPVEADKKRKTAQQLLSKNNLLDCKQRSTLKTCFARSLKNAQLSKMIRSVIKLCEIEIGILVNHEEGVFVNRSWTIVENRRRSVF